jgi:hypothetical protein
MKHIVISMRRTPDIAFAVAALSCSDMKSTVVYLTADKRVLTVRQLRLSSGLGFCIAVRTPDPWVRSVRFMGSELSIAPQIPQIRNIKTLTYVGIEGHHIAMPKAGAAAPVYAESPVHGLW